MICELVIYDSNRFFDVDSLGYFLVVEPLEDNKELFVFVLSLLF
jgi:hypothetical protein